MLLLWQLLIEMLGLPDFLGFYPVNFLCFREGENRVNIQGVSTDKTTRKSVHKFWRNSQFSLLTCIALMFLKNLMIFFLTARERKSFTNCKKNSPSATRAICVLDLIDVIKIEMLAPFVPIPRAPKKLYRATWTKKGGSIQF